MGIDSSTFTLYADAGDTVVPVGVVRRRVKNLNLTVRADGTVALSIPKGASRGAAQMFLDRRAGWIVRHLDRRTRCAGGKPATEIAGADRIPLWGELVDAADAAARMDSGPLVEDLYRAELARALPSLAERIERRMGLHATSWQIKSMTSRWGSCTPTTGAVRISTALAAYPRVCLACVITHELAHLIEPSHNSRFHELLDRYFPKNRAVSARLRRPPLEISATRRADLMGAAP